jgi:glycosyltransferase involved in cell wall biosynthesis
MGPVRIAHVATVDSSLRGLLLNQLTSLRTAGYEVAGISSPGPDVPAIETAGIRHIPVPMARGVAPLLDLRALLKLWRVMRRERFTIVHTHTPKAGLLGQLAARLAGVPVVVNTLHGFYFHEHMRPRARRFYIAIEKIAASCSDSVLSQNREDIQTGLDECIFSPPRVRHLGNGIDLSEFDPARVSPAATADLRERLGVPPGAPVVGFVGRLAAKRKGFMDFLEMARRVRERKRAARFLIIGNPDHGKPDAVEPAAAAEYGISEACLFLGHRPNAELPALYRSMDVLVLPSLFEGIPRVIMEAAAMGVPSVATNVKGNREAVVPGRTGLLVPWGDVPALAQAVLDIVGDAGRARTMGGQARALALERFDERAVFATVKTEYARLLREKGLSDAAGPSLAQERLGL